MEIIELLDVLDSSTVKIELDISRNRKFNGTALLMITMARTLSNFDVILFSSASFSTACPQRPVRNAPSFSFSTSPSARSQAKRS